MMMYICTHSHVEQPPDTDLLTMMLSIPNCRQVLMFVSRFYHLSYDDDDSCGGGDGDGADHDKGIDD